MAGTTTTHGARRLPPSDINLGQSRRIVTFTFDDQSLTGFEVEPVAVALLAAGARVFRTMPDSGESRGCFCFIGRCADCLLVVDGQSGVRSCVTPLREGMCVETQIGLGVPPTGGD